jgi:hypothetical protein
VVSSQLVDASVARALAREALGEAAGAVVYVDRMPRGSGMVSVGPEEVRIERAALVVFRDEAPGANWMHPCTYALVDLETGDVVTTAAADRPPQFGLLPDTWVVAADPAGRADLLPPHHDLKEER